jgi:hypothetical protein
MDQLQPRQVTVDDIDSFRAVRRGKPHHHPESPNAVATEWQRVSASSVSVIVKDWGGEQRDLISTRLPFKGVALLPPSLSRAWNCRETHSSWVSMRVNAHDRRSA